MPQRGTEADIHPSGSSGGGGHHAGHPHSHSGPHGHDPGFEGWTREMAVAALESPERKKSLDPEAVWKEVGLRKGSTVVEIGAGTGYFSIPAARTVGSNGKVYAVDISKDLVGYLQERGAQEHLPQFQAVHSSVERVPLEDGIADFVLLANVLHDVPDATVREALRLLAPTGCLVNLDWKKEETPNGPPPEIRLSPEEATMRLRALGLKVEHLWTPGPYHYGMVLRR